MSQEESARRMSFYDHLDELRARVVRCAIVFSIGFIGFYFVAEHILEFLRAPLFAVLPEAQRKLYFTNLFEGFMVHLKIAGYASVVFLSPYFFYQLWGFIAPGLYPKERKLVVPFVSAASIFFIGGSLFAYYVLFPKAFQFFVTYGSATDVPLLTMDSYYGTALKLMLLFGVAFEIPVMITLLGFLGVVNADGLRKSRKPAIMVITILSALFAPPDAVSMIILMAPLLIFYEAAILVVAWIGRKRVQDAGTELEAATKKENEDPLRGKSEP